MHLCIYVHCRFTCTQSDHVCACQTSPYIPDCIVRLTNRRGIDTAPPAQSDQPVVEILEVPNEDPTGDNEEWDEGALVEKEGGVAAKDRGILESSAEYLGLQGGNPKVRLICGTVLIAVLGEHNTEGALRCSHMQMVFAGLKDLQSTWGEGAPHMHMVFAGLKTSAEYLGLFGGGLRGERAMPHSVDAGTESAWCRRCSVHGCFETVGITGRELVWGMRSHQS